MEDVKVGLESLIIKQLLNLQKMIRGAGMLQVLLHPLWRLWLIRSLTLSIGRNPLNYHETIFSW
jgi:hypothetical protein